MCGCLPGVEAAEEAEIAETDFNAELAEIAENLPGNFSASSARSAFRIVSARPPLAPRSPERAEGAEIAETHFNAEFAEIAENPSWKLLSVLCALGVSHRLSVLGWLSALQGAHCATSRFVAARVNSLRPANVVRNHGSAL
jgi:hypothetical protein